MNTLEIEMANLNMGSEPPYSKPTTSHGLSSEDYMYNEMMRYE